MKEKIISGTFNLLLFLVWAEDSTEHSDSGKKYHFTGFCNPGYFGKIKAVFWIIISVLFSMMLAQLN